MKKFMLIIILLKANIILCQINIDMDIYSYLKKKRAVNADYYLFTAPELIELCKDTVERSKYLNNIHRDLKFAKSKGEDNIKEQRVLFSLIYNNIKNVRIDNKNAKSKDFILSTLKPYLINFEINEALLLARFKADEDLSVCTSCKSMLIFILYDPELYVKVRSKENNYLNSKNHFPIAYTIQDCNVPIIITKRMKTLLLNKLQVFKDPIIVKIKDELTNADINNRCN